MFVTGWKRDLPDVRDYTIDSSEIKAITEKSNKLKLSARAVASVDLRKWCSPVEDQGDLGSCTSQAGVSLLEYYQKRAFNKYINGSRLFLYKTTRNLEKQTGDTGAYLRDTMKAMVLFGIPPEEYWAYEENKFDKEPTAFVYSLANNYKSIKYYKLDPSGTSTQKLLINVKSYVASGLPSMFGFTVYSSITNAAGIPYPVKGDKAIGGHAVVCVGYDDAKVINGQTGALLIKNSWGTSWGENGFGWLPYAYIINGLAVDFWSLVQAEFVDTELFN
jgi:C1A family cysteine protease